MNGNYYGTERRNAERREHVPLTPEQVEALADRAATKALERVYTEIGRNVVRKAIWLVGAVVVSVLAWLTGQGKLFP